MGEPLHREPRFRTGSRVLTAVWGTLLFFDAAVSVVLSDLVP